MLQIANKRQLRDITKNKNVCFTLLTSNKESASKVPGTLIAKLAPPLAILAHRKLP